MSLIELKNLKRNYRSFPALRGLDLSLEAGHIVGLMGPNGSGKTTLLRILGAFDMSYSGEVLINGKKPGLESRAITSYLPDRPSFPEHNTPIQLIRLYQRFFSDFNDQKARKMLESLDLDLAQPLSEMSKGMKEKVQVVMTMSRDAKIYLLDEPISGVDPAARQVILKLILENYNPDSLLILSTHQIHDIEAVIDDVIFLKWGEITLFDNADAVREREHKSINELFEEVFQ